MPSLEIIGSYITSYGLVCVFEKDNFFHLLMKLAGDVFEFFEDENMIFTIYGDLPLYWNNINLTSRRHYSAQKKLAVKKTEKNQKQM